MEVKRTSSLRDPSVARVFANKASDPAGDPVSDDAGYADPGGPAIATFSIDRASEPPRLQAIDVVLRMDGVARVDGLSQAPP